jgi:hypothetical protein
MTGLSLSPRSYGDYLGPRATLLPLCCCHMLCVRYSYVVRSDVTSSRFYSHAELELQMQAGSSVCLIVCSIWCTSVWTCMGSKFPPACCHSVAPALATVCLCPRTDHGDRYRVGAACFSRFASGNLLSHMHVGAQCRIYKNKEEMIIHHYLPS